MYYLTSDLHISHAKIIIYCNRPFKDVEEMNETIIRNWNKVVKEDDIVIHVGDFCFKGGNGKNWLSRLNGSKIMIKGNHDTTSSYDAIINAMTITYHGHNIFIAHRPPTHRAEVPDFTDFIVCGHVHEQWATSSIDRLDGRKIPIINVGVDVRKFTPVSIDQVVSLYKQVRNQK
jgi:calcineurin-like phosphoesterase family protein